MEVQWMNNWVSSHHKLRFNAALMDAVHIKYSISINIYYLFYKLF